MPCAFYLNPRGLLLVCLFVILIIFISLFKLNTDKCCYFLFERTKHELKNRGCLNFNVRHFLCRHSNLNANNIS